MSNNTTHNIQDLSSAGFILSTDNVFVFTKDPVTEKYSTISVAAKNLSALFINTELLNQIKSKYTELQLLSANFKSFLKENYILSNRIDTIFSTPKYFESVYRHNNTTTSVLSNDFSDFATKAYATQYKEYAFSELAKYKRVAGKSTATLVMQVPGWL